MIQIIRQVCQKAQCEPKDLVVEWTPAKGVRLIGTNPQGEKTSLHVLCRVEQIVHAIYLCANGQEHLYPQIQQQQAIVEARFKEWLTATGQKRQTAKDPQQQSASPNARPSVQKDWREFHTVAEIVRFFPIHPSADDVIDLYQRNKTVKSDHLRALLEKHSRSTTNSR